MQQRLCQSRPLAITFGKLSQSFMAFRSESGLFDHFLHLSPSFFHAVQRPHHAEVFPDIHMPVKRIVFRQVSDAFPGFHRSEEPTSELQSLMRISYAVFCLKKKNQQNVNYM